MCFDKVIAFLHIVFSKKSLIFFVCVLSFAVVGWVVTLHDSETLTTDRTRTTTWMAFYNHDLLKATHLLSNCRAIQSMRKVMTEKDRTHFNARFEKRNRRRANPRVYHSAVQKRDGSKGWQGGPHLASSAEYTSSFCLAVYQCWLEAQPAQPAQPWRLFDVMMLSEGATKMVIASALLTVNNCEISWVMLGASCSTNNVEQSWWLTLFQTCG